MNLETVRVSGIALAAILSAFAQRTTAVVPTTPTRTGAAASGPAFVSAALPPGAIGGTSSFTSTPSLAIVDVATVSDSIVVSGTSLYLWDLDVVTSIQHTWAADLDLTLSSPQGTLITLTTDNGGGNDDVFDGTLWDDTAVDLPCTDATYVDSVPATPLNSEGSLDRFRGEDPNGTWTLTITDDAAADVGVLSSWTLDVTALTATPPEVTACFTSTPGLALADLTTTYDTIPVFAMNTFLQRVRVYTEIRHTFNADLELRLSSPSGTTIRLGTDNGGAEVDVYAGTMWDENASTPVTDALYASGVVTRVVSPEAALAAFIAEDPNGTWTLAITDDAAADVGVLDRWWLLITTDGSGAALPTIDYCDVITGTGTPPLDLSPKTLFVQPGDAATWRITNAFAHSCDTISPFIATTARISYTGLNPSTGPNPAIFDVIPAGGADMEFSVVIECAATSGAYGYDFELYDENNALLCTIDPVIFVGSPATVVDCQILPTPTQGCSSVASSTGAPSANPLAPPFQITFGALNAQVNGVAFYGLNGPQNVAWSAQSLLCVKAPTVRLNGVVGAFGNTGGTLGGCNGQYSFDFNSVIAAASISAGTTVVVQGWQRDPVALKTTNLTDALSFVVGP